MSDSAAKLTFCVAVPPARSHVVLGTALQILLWQCLRAVANSSVTSLLYYVFPDLPSKVAAAFGRCNCQQAD